MDSPSVSSLASLAESSQVSAFYNTFKLLGDFSYLRDSAIQKSLFISVQPVKSTYPAVKKKQKISIHQVHSEMSEHLKGGVPQSLPSTGFILS